MWIAEQFLYLGAKSLRSSSVAHNDEMKAALKSIDADDAYRAKEVDRVSAALERYSLSIAGKKILDLGCNDGALTSGYLARGAAEVVGVDVDEKALARARELHRDPRLTFLSSGITSLPLPDNSVDAAISYDVFEHIAKPLDVTTDLYRVLRPGGWVLIGTWSWRHPFAPHLWSVMPVPWAHLVVSERTLLRACRRVYYAPWYSPTRHDLDASGQRLPDKYKAEKLSRDYLNQFLITDFERVFEQAGFACDTRPVPFGSSYARWTRPLAHMPWLREFLSGYVWFILRKPEV